MKRSCSIALGILAFTILCPEAKADDLRLFPDNLEYQGAFKLPKNNNADEYKTWCYGGSALAYFPDGDSTGAVDGFPGSLYGVGHNYELQVSELAIPIPKKLAAGGIDALPTAKTLQDFQSITGGVLPTGTEMRVSGLEYLPPLGNQDKGGLFFSMGHHWMNFDPAGADQPTHWHSDINLSKPKPSGPFKLANENAFKTSGYIFEIDPAWAAVNTPGKRLAAGGFREHIGGSYGPSLYAYSSTNESNPNLSGTSLDDSPLFEYGLPPDSMINNYHSDFWTGGAWLSSQGKSAVVLMGNKGLGTQWYGVAAGGYKGWNADPYIACMLFFDPADLAKVVKGLLKPCQVQPFALLDIDKLMLKQGQRNIGGTAFDRARGILYVCEASGTDPLIHVWKIKSAAVGLMPLRNGGRSDQLTLLPIPGGSGIRVHLGGGLRQDPLVLDLLDVRGGQISRTMSWPGAEETSIDLTTQGLAKGGVILRAQYGKMERSTRIP